MSGVQIIYIKFPELKYKATRNVGQCPTWWSPCRI